MTLGVFCTGPGVGPDNPCCSLPTQSILLLYDMYYANFGEERTSNSRVN